MCVTQLREIRGRFCLSRIYEGNIIETEFIVSNKELSIHYIGLIDLELRENVIMDFVENKKPFNLVFNFHNIVSVDSATLGMAMQCKIQMDTYHGMAMDIYYINVSDDLKIIYKCVGINGFFVACDSLDEISKILKDQNKYYTSDKRLNASLRKESDVCYQNKYSKNVCQFYVSHRRACIRCIREKSMIKV